MCHEWEKGKFLHTHLPVYKPSSTYTLTHICICIGEYLTFTLSARDGYFNDFFVFVFIFIFFFHTERWTWLFGRFSVPIRRPVQHPLSGYFGVFRRAQGRRMGWIITSDHVVSALIAVSVTVQPSRKSVLSSPVRAR